MNSRTQFIHRLIYRVAKGSDVLSLEIITPGGSLHVFETRHADEQGLLLEDADLILLPAQDDSSIAHANFARLIARWLAPRLGMTGEEPDAATLREMARTIADELTRFGLTPDADEQANRDSETEVSQ